MQQINRWTKRKLPRHLNCSPYYYLYRSSSLNLQRKNSSTSKLLQYKIDFQGEKKKSEANMLRILGKDLRFSKSTTMVTRSESEIDAHDVFDDLSSWEFVNPSDDEQEDSYSFTDHTDDNDDDELMLKEDDPCEIGSPSSDISMKSESESPSPVETIGALVISHVGFDYHDSSHDDDQEEEEEEEEEEEDYDDDLDDELVPNWLSDKFGRQRIRKLGKRACSKLNKSKRGPYIFNRPGCVHGKHGFGMQHSYV